MAISFLPSQKKKRMDDITSLVESLKQVEEVSVEDERINLKDKKVLIYDYGLLTEFAVRLARDFGKVYYFCHWETTSPKTNLALIGDGLEGVERVLNFWDYVDKVDLICIFDTYTGDIVDYLRGKGYRVFGAGKAEFLETNREKTRKLQEALKLPTQNTKVIKGVSNLIQHLKGVEDKWIKFSTFRGDFESFYHSKYDETAAQDLGGLQHTLGAKGATITFLVEDSIDGVEPGYDGWVIDGQYPSKCLYGYEKKDEGYIGKVIDYENLPKALKKVNTALSPIFKKYTARTFYSSEVRVDKRGVGYLIDPTVRVPLPPSGIELEIWKNFSEIVWFGAEGKMVDPIPTAKYAAEVIVGSSPAKEGWVHIEIPKEIRQWVKFRNIYKTPEGKFYAVPGEKTICSVIGLGNTIDEAVNLVKKRVEQVKAKSTEFSHSALDDLQNKTIPEGRKLGIDF